MSTKSAVAELWRTDGVHSTKLRISPQDIYTNFAFQTTADADVPNGASVLVLGASGCFSQVQLPSGRQGWVKTTHLRASSTTIKAESPSTPRVSGSSSARTPPTQPRLPSHSSHHASDFDGFASSRQLHRAVGCNQRVAGSSAKSAAVPDVDMCLDAMKERLEVLQRVDSPITRSDFSTRSPADKLKYLERISGSSPSASAHVSQPAAAVSSADQAWEGLEEFCDVLFDVVSKRSTSDSQGWRSKSVAQKIRYLAELKTPIIGNTPLPSKSGFVRAHKYPVFLAAEAMATMTDEQRMIMLNFQNASSNYMLKRSQEKHNQWEQELRDCVEKGKAMSPAAIQHVACQVHSLIEHYQAELATPDADKAQLDGWLKEALKPLTLINPTGADEKFKAGKGLDRPIDKALERFSDRRLLRDVRELFNQAKREAAASELRNEQIEDPALAYLCAKSKGISGHSAHSFAKGRQFTPDERPYRMKKDGTFDQRFKIKDASQLHRHSQQSSDLCSGHDCVGRISSADHRYFPSSPHTFSTGVHTAADGNRFRITREGSFDQRFKIKGFSQLQLHSHSPIVGAGYDCVGGAGFTDHCPSFAFGGGGFSVSQGAPSSFAPRQPHSGPRAGDGSLDMRFACNRGKSKYDD
jgi:hypothetical protein